MKHTSKIILIVLLVISFITYQLWSYLLETYNIQVFYPGIAVLITGLTYVIWMETPKRTGFKYFTELFFLLAFNNLIDEAFFNPTKIEANEIIVAGILIVRFFCIIWILTTNKQFKNSLKK